MYMCVYTNMLYSFVLPLCSWVWSRALEYVNLPGAIFLMNMDFPSPSVGGGCLFLSQLLRSEITTQKLY